MQLLVVRIEGDSESHAAADWASEQGWPVTVVNDGDPLPPLSDTNAVWIHGDRVPRCGADAAARLRTWTVQGGGIVLSLVAAAAANSLGAAGPAPRHEGPRRWTPRDDPLWTGAAREWPEYPHVRGLQGWGPHPLFAGLCRGTYTWCATEGEVVSAALFRKPDWPDDAARVVAVERAYIHLGADVAVAWEYEIGAGHLLCIGAHVRFTAPDRSLTPQRDTIVRNALEYAGSGKRTGGPRAYWPSARRQHASVAVLPRLRALPVAVDAQVPPLAIQIREPDESPFTLAGSAALVVGTESGGVSEVWLHPLCVLSDLDVRVDGLRPTCGAAIVSPGALERNLATGGRALARERLVVHPSRAEVHYQLLPSDDGPAPQQLEVTFRLPLRLQWPLPVDALIPCRVEIAAGDGRHALVVTGRDGQHLSAIFIDGTEKPVIMLEEDEGSLIRLRSTDGEGIRLAITATATGRAALPATESAADALHEQQRRLIELQQRTASVVTGDADVDAAWPRAIARLSSFMADGPYGRGLMAGYAASIAGWGRSRPGYAWFFGRDACWTVDALLAVGMHNEARDAIALLVGASDVTGKVPHEITTSGVVHYDAADATPLLLRAVAAYAAWTGDLETVRTWWPEVRRALEFCVSCDRDGDGLPENTGVGHGWVESGPLGGGAVTSYAAAIWIDALRRLRPVALAIGDAAGAGRLASLRVSAEEGFAALRDPASGRLALHRLRDGRLVTDLTALAAVPIALGVDTSPSADDILDTLGAPRFSAPWGLRMLPTDDPRYDPVGYHSGAVWPLFTGWAALADARRGAVDRAFARIRATATLAGQRSKGAFDEVLHGDTGAGAGVCPDQAWSAAMVLTPIMIGLLGFEPDAVRGEVRLRPQLPTTVTRLIVSNVLTGSTRLSTVCQRIGRGDTVEVQLDASAENRETVTVLLGDQRVPLRAGGRVVLTFPERA